MLPVTPASSRVKVPPGHKGAWAKPSGRDYVAAVLGNPLPWLAVTVSSATIAVLINYLLTLAAEPWSVPLIACPAATTFSRCC